MHQADEYTSEAYWSSIWQRTRPGNIAVWEADPAVRQQSKAMKSLVERLQERTDRVNVLEVGCANSFWLPHLGRQPGVIAYGLDYSSHGCFQARNQLERQQVPANVFCGDFFDLAKTEQSRFDLIISFGFIEHFSEPSAALDSMRRLLRPGGFVFATVPNISGIYAPLVRMMDEDVYNGHVLMDDTQIRAQATKAGFDQVESGYLGGAVYFSVLNFQTAKTRMSRACMSVASRLARVCDIAVGSSLEALGLNRNNRLASPYVYVIGQRA